MGGISRGLQSARSCQRLVLKPAMQRLNPAVVEAGPLDWRHTFAKGGCRDVRPAAQYLSLASPRERHQREGDPAVRDPFGATCGAHFRRGPRKLASLRFAQTARGPDPLEAVLLGTDRGDGEPGSPSGHRCARPRLSSTGIGVGSRFRTAKLVLRPQSRNGGRSAGFLPIYACGSALPSR